MRPQFTPEWIERFWSRVDRSGGRDACWPWLHGLSERGYGTATFRHQRFIAHRIAYFLEYGAWPEPFGLHDCDNPPCCNPSHIIPGTQAENMADKAAKGRAPTGDDHWSHQHPEWRLTGNDHWSKYKPESYARGERHGTQTHPGCVPSGDDHYSRRLPELVKRGESVALAKLTAETVKAIRREYSDGATMRALADKFGVTPPTIFRVVHRQCWAHVE